MPRVFELDLHLLGVTPRLWRRVRIPADVSLLDLHHVVQAVMDWDDYHLHLFEVAGREYGPRPEEESEREHWAGDDAAITVAKAFAESGGPIDYVYDFGDEWRLEITVIADAIATGSIAVECVGGELAGPPEDSGGPHAYQEILDSLTSKGKRGLSAEIRNWLPKGFDAMQFSVDAANLRLREVFRPKASLDFPAGPHASAEQQLLANLTLAVLFLGSRETRHGTREAWKTVRFELLDTLQEAGLIVTNSQRKSVVITEIGVEHAKALVERLAPLVGRAG